MKQIAFLFSFIFLLYSCSSKETQLSDETFYMPAEWEPHEAVWLGWEKDSTQRFYPSIAVPNSNRKEYPTEIIIIKWGKSDI